LALKEGIIDAAIVAEAETEYLPHGVMVKNPADVSKRAKSKFVVSPTVAKFNEVAKREPGNIGVVATPCQALALAKMRLKPVPEKDNNIDKLRLVIGLFCGWALSWEHLKQVLAGKLKSKEVAVLGMDIPPSQYHCMEVYTNEGTVSISLDEILPCVRASCDYCFDMTAEFSDISVGSARSEKGWEDAKGWNQVVVRTDAGQALLDLARSKGVLEFRDVPKANLEKLKKASMNKKSHAVKKLIELSGSSENLIYLDSNDPVMCTFKK
jgi:coenzyme F420 hydrogenase subunit beta